MNYPNYRDFYQKALVPIGLKDRAVLGTIDTDSAKLSTHWLITLEGICISQPKEFYHWKVSIYPSNCEGSFIWNEAYYSSSHIDSIDKAIDLARSFEIYSKNDELHSVNLQEKIS